MTGMIGTYKLPATGIEDTHRREITHGRDISKMPSDLRYFPGFFDFLQVESRKVTSNSESDFDLDAGKCASEKVQKVAICDIIK